MVGVLFGIAIFAATKGKFLLTVLLMVGGFAFGSRYNKGWQDLQAEIERRGAE